jgi:hypothetical protein
VLAAYYVLYVFACMYSYGHKCWIQDYTWLAWIFFDVRLLFDTRCLAQNPSRGRFMIMLLHRSSTMSLKATIVLSLPLGKLGPEKPIPWRGRQCRRY